MKTFKELEPIDHAHIEALRKLQDNDIDCSVIPPLTDEQMAKCRPAYLRRQEKPEVKVRIAPDILKWFSEHSSNAEQKINAVLRSAMV
jgi:uncharacterized protein (DUF4415 family)